MPCQVTNSSFNGLDIEQLEKTYPSRIFREPGHNQRKFGIRAIHIKLYSDAAFSGFENYRSQLRFILLYIGESKANFSFLQMFSGLSGDCQQERKIIWYLIWFAFRMHLKRSNFTHWLKYWLIKTELKLLQSWLMFTFEWHSHFIEYDTGNYDWIERKMCTSAINRGDECRKCTVKRVSENQEPISMDWISCWQKGSNSNRVYLFTFTPLYQRLYASTHYIVLLYCSKGQCQDALRWVQRNVIVRFSTNFEKVRVFKMYTWTFHSSLFERNCE